MSTSDVLKSAVAMGQAFLVALENGLQVDVLMTPEALAAGWNKSVARQLADTTRSVSNLAKPARGANDVAYLAVFRETAEDLGGTDGVATFGAGGRLGSDVLVGDALIVTLVWRPELGMWRVHAFGPDYVSPEKVPRTSPDDAPWPHSI